KGRMRFGLNTCEKTLDSLRHGARGTNEIYAPRRRQQRFSPALGLIDDAALLLHHRVPDFLLCFLVIHSCHLDVWRKAIPTNGTTEKRTLRYASFGGPFLPTAMSREGSLTAAELWSSGSNPVVPLSVCCQVQAFKCYTEPRFQLTRTTSSSPGRLESHKPLRGAPLHQTDGRSRSITSSVPSYFGIISLPSYRKVMLSSPPLIIDRASFPLRRSFAGDFVSFVSRARMTASPEDLSFSYYTIIFILWESFTGGFTGIGYPSFLLLGFIVVADSLIGLSSCVAISTGSEDATETTSVVLVDEVWTSTSHSVTIFQLSDFVVKAHSTHSSFVSNSLSSSVEDLSFLDYLCGVCYVYGQRGCIIPSCYCSEKV
ncbi:hypothetical protein HID58_009179, partial [Brassica napus]